MNSPRVAARIKQRHCGSRLRINAGLPGALAEGAGDASQGEVFHYRFPAGVNRLYMINMEDCLLASLGQTAVFAALAARRMTWRRRCAGTHVVMLPAGACAERAAEARRAPRSSPPVLQLRFFPPESGLVPDPACPKALEAFSGHLSAGGTAPGHQASLLRFGWLQA